MKNNLKINPRSLQKHHHNIFNHSILYYGYPKSTGTYGQFNPKLGRCGTAGSLPGFTNLKNIRSVYIQDQSVIVNNNQIVEYRITAKLSFEIEHSTGSPSE